METVAVKAVRRSEVRGKGARATRLAGKIPAVVYGGDTVEIVSVEFLDVRHAIYTPAFKLVELDLEGEKVSCILKEVQFHPVTEDIVHIDFLRLIPGHPLKVELPVKFVGVAPGLKAGGTLVQKMRRIRIKTVPEKLVDELTIDVSELKLGFSVRVKDAQVAEGVEILNPPATPVASIEIPRALRGGDEDEEEEEGTDGEGETEEAPAAEA